MSGGNQNPTPTMINEVYSHCTNVKLSTHWFINYYEHSFDDDRFIIEIIIIK